VARAGRLFGSAPVDWLVVGLGNPGERYARTPHNVGFLVADELARRWDLPRPKSKYAGRFTEGRTEPGGPRVGLLWPQTYMNEAGRSVGPARGALKVDLDRLLVVHDEIDLPFGDVRTRVGGGLAGHVLGRWRQSPGEVSELVGRAADLAEGIVAGRRDP
jgi:peptidyl-tRNA hydrolase, PTH1 family